MKVAVVVCAVLSVACAGAIYPYPGPAVVRAPQFDSARISSERLGGNFAYSSLEALAYASINPVVQNVISPVGVSYTATPLQYPAPAVYPAFAPAPAPALFASAPIAPVYPGFAPIAPIAPITSIAPIAPVTVSDAAAPLAPEAPATPEADSAEPSPAASDDSVTIEAA